VGVSLEMDAMRAMDILLGTNEKPADPGTLEILRTQYARELAHLRRWR
jgi:hypothetical protein